MLSSWGGENNGFRNRGLEVDGFRAPGGRGRLWSWPGELLRRDVVFGVLALLFKDQQQSRE